MDASEQARGFGSPAPRGASISSQGRRSDKTGRDERNALSVAILDSDSGFLAVLLNRLDRLGWNRRILSPGARDKTLRSLDADVLIVDVANLGPRRWARLAGLCEQRLDLRVIICAGPSTVGERVCALRAGADDWLSKPCHPEELIARIEAVVGDHRPFAHGAPDSVCIGELEIRPHQFQAFAHGESLHLTQREYQLIELLAQGDGEVVHRADIYRAMWQSEMGRDDRSVDVLVHKLRRKLEQVSPEWAYIHTHYRVGYRLAPERMTALPEPVQIHCGAPAPTTLAA